MVVFITKVKVFVCGQQRQGYDNSSPDSRHVELKILKGDNLSLTR